MMNLPSSPSKHKSSVRFDSMQSSSWPVVPVPGRDDSSVSYSTKTPVSEVGSGKLISPFPIPRVYHSTIPRTKRSVGVTFTGRKAGEQGDVRIDTIQETSPFYTTDLDCGQQLLAVNYKVVTTAVEAVQIFRDDPSRTLTFTTAEHTLATRQYKTVCAPTSHLSPGIRFSTTRHRGLVTVGKIYTRGNFDKTGLREEDIVIAVNGYPVSKPEDADRALHMTRSEPMTSLYVLDVVRLRASIAREASKMSDKFLLVSFGLAEGKDREFVIAISGMAHGKVEFDRETLHMRYFEENTYRVPRHERDKFSHLVQEFIQAFNKVVEDRMSTLEELVASEAWQNPVPVPSAWVTLNGISISGPASQKLREARKESMLRVAEKGTDNLVSI
jgi:hypothetical protein